MLKFAVLALFVAVVAAGDFKFSDCGHGEVTKLDLSDCSGSHCVIHKGKEFKMSADFVANQSSEKVEIKIIAKVNGLEIPVPGVESNGCNHMKCPVTKGQKYTFNYGISIPKLLPNIKALVTAKLIGDHGVLACLIVDGEIKN
uniref:Group 2 allergen Ale o 2 n=1 Tax=Aleuroglyphus ovatus TaxID=212130 RepID=A7XZH4_ALEOV|nr:group 2 allergen Ale o 2 [Aleuroglyphus ovatus]